MRHAPWWRLGLLLFGILMAFVSYGYFRLSDLNRRIETTWAAFEEAMRWEGDIVLSLISEVETVTDTEKITADSARFALRNLLLARSKKHMIEAYRVMHRTASRLLDLKSAQMDTLVDPQLKILVDELKEASGQVDSLSTEYDRLVRRYNGLLSTFPYNIIAEATGFIPEPQLPLTKTDGNH